MTLYRIYSGVLNRIRMYYTKVMNFIHKNKILFNDKVKIGDNTTIYYRSQIVDLCKKGQIKIGNKCSIGRSKFGYHAGMPFYTTLFIYGNESYITIGDKCRINGAYIHAQKNITIGNNCVIASGVNIIDSNGHETYSKDRTTGNDIPESITIGDNVWIGINSTILKGSIIGDNCIVSAHSVVKGTFPSNCIISGNPARIIKEMSI